MKLVRTDFNPSDLNPWDFDLFFQKKNDSRSDSFKTFKLIDSFTHNKEN